MSKYIPLSTLLTNTCTAQSCTLGIQNQNCISTIASRYLFQKQYDIALYKGHVRQPMFLYTKTTWRNTSASEHRHRLLAPPPLSRHSISSLSALQFHHFI